MADSKKAAMQTDQITLDAEMAEKIEQIAQEKKMSPVELLVDIFNSSYQDTLEEKKNTVQER